MWGIAICDRHYSASKRIWLKVRKREREPQKTFIMRGCAIVCVSVALAAPVISGQGAWKYEYQPEKLSLPSLTNDNDDNDLNGRLANDHFRGRHVRT